MGNRLMEHMAAAQGGDWVIDNRLCERRDGETVETGWIRSAQAGDHAAFAELVRLHEQRVLRVAWRLLGGLHAAQDAAQDVFLRMHKYLMTVDPNRDLSPWLYRVTVNVCREHARQRRRVAVSEMEHVRNVDQARANGAAIDARDWLDRGLKRLTERERAALVLRDLEGLSAKEAAAAMRCTAVTVRTLAARARLKLKRLHEAEELGDTR